jgi:pyrophosphatase PpaX
MHTAANPGDQPSGSSPTPPRAVLFDLDGTLIDSIELILTSARHAFGRMGRPWVTDSAWLAGVGTPLATMFGRFAADEQEIQSFIAGYREYQLANHDRLVRRYDGVAETLGVLRSRGHRMAIVTSKTCALAERGLTHTGLSHFVETIVGCDSCSRHKPDPEPVRVALERLGAEPGEAVFVGDSTHDILAGNAAGVRTYAALWGPFSRAELQPAKPAAFLDRVEDLPLALT